MSLVTDTNPLMQPEGTYPFGFNLVNSTKDNAVSAVSSEPGTSLVHTYAGGYEVIGKIYFDNKVLVFSTDNTTSNIGIIENDRYRTIYTGNLGFNQANKILGQHRTLKGCEDIFYFSDGTNPDRFFNLTDIPTTVEGFNILRSTQEPNIEVQINNTGGSMPASVVSFQLRYVHLDGDIFDSSEPTINYPVYNDTISNVAQGSNGTTQKSATLTITNVDTRFPYVKLIAVHNVNGTYQAYEIDSLVATDTTLVIEYQGPTTNDTQIDNRDIVVGSAQYNRTLVNEQVLGRLLRANVQEIEDDYSSHQLLVNDIKVLPEIVQIPKSEFTQDPSNYNNLTFQSDEVYALGLRFTDSTLVKQPTPVYHIPGREARAGELDTRTLGGESYLRYEIENTAEDIPNSVRGMGYYQTSTNYPNIKDCNGEYVYGDLQGTPVRHHRMPSRRTVALENNSTLQSINITLDNVVLPTGYDGYKVFYVARTDTNSTVVDSGYAHKGRFLDNQYYLKSQLISNVQFSNNATDSSSAGANIFSLTSPESLLSMNVKGTYLDLQNEYVYDYNNIQFNGTDLNVDPDLPNVSLVEVPTTIARNINTSLSYDKLVVIQPNSKDINSFNFATINDDELNPVTATFLDYNAQEYSMTYYVNKRVKSVHNNVASLIYKPLNEEDGVYYGDTFITRFSNLTGDRRTGASDIFTVLGYVISDLWVESKINYQLLLGDHFRYNKDTYEYVVENMMEQREDGNYFVIAPDQEDYQLSMSYAYGSIKPYFPLPLTYDYCDLCRSSSPSRIIYSPQSFQEELSDSYLISNNNDYIDLPSNSGPITGLKYKNNRLYVHTTQTTYVLTPNPQYLSTNQSVAQLQTGDFLSVPPQEIIQADHGYGGMHDKMASVNCEFGYFWVDGLRGSLNSIQQSFKSISNEGMMSWFKNNLNPDSETILGFDPYFSRLLMTTSGNLCQPYHTLSYSLTKNSFTAFHSDNPELYLNNSTTLYKAIKNKIRKQTTDSLFNQAPSVIEQVTKSMQTSNLISLTHYTEFFENDQEVKDTFSELIVYNANQSTGKIELYEAGPYDSLFYQGDKRPVKIQDKNHNIANLWDNSTSNVVTQTPCNEPVYTDKKFVNTVVGGSHYDRPLFKEKYTVARLTYNPTEDRRMTHYLLQQNKQQSTR